LEQKFRDPGKFEISISSRKRLRDGVDVESDDPPSNEKALSSLLRNDINLSAAAVSKTSNRILTPKTENSDKSVKKKLDPKKLEDPAEFKKFSKEELLSNGILVQKRRYKNVKTLPIVGGTTVSTEKGQTVVFYKRRKNIWMEISGRIFLPDVEPEHVAGIFRDFSPEELSRNDLGQVQRLSGCPLCHRRFNTEAELLTHCADCNGDEDADPKEKPEDLRLKFFVTSSNYQTFHARFLSFAFLSFVSVASNLLNKNCVQCAQTAFILCIFMCSQGAIKQKTYE
jgi:hypothetical protein